MLTNQRHLAIEQAARGVAVRYRVAPSYADAVRELAAEVGRVRMMEAAERELRDELAPLVEEGLLEVVPHQGWLTTAADFATLGDAPWRMDAFYRAVRRRTGVLMEDGSPVGGRYSFDGDNREPWKGTPTPPDLPEFPPDAITLEVVALVASAFGDHPGTLAPRALPASAADAERHWQWALHHCLEHFGTYEDAMAAERVHAVPQLSGLSRRAPAKQEWDRAVLAAVTPADLPSL